MEITKAAISGFDAAAFSAGAAILIGAAFLACLLPARRVMNSEASDFGRLLSSSYEGRDGGVFGTEDRTLTLSSTVDVAASRSD